MRSWYSPAHIDVSATLGNPVVDHYRVLADEILHIHLVLAVAGGSETHTRPGGLGLLPVVGEVEVRCPRAEAEVQCRV